MSSSLPGIGGHKNRYSLSPSNRRAGERGRNTGRPLAATYTGSPSAVAGNQTEDASASFGGAPAASARVAPSLQYLQTAQNTLASAATTTSGRATTSPRPDAADKETFLTEAPMSAAERAPVTSAAAYHLGPSESRVAALKEEAAERWRSKLLQYETDARELVAMGSSLPPTTESVMEAIRIYDGVARIAEGESPHLAEMLRLLRIEFSRAVFSGYRLDFSQEDGPVGDLAGNTRAFAYHAPRDDADIDTVVPYFDQVTSLLRENAGLQSEIALGNTRERLVQLTQQVEALSETVRMYENEIGRLTRQNQHSLDECRKARQDFQDYKTTAEAQQVEMGKEIQALNVENKDMQLQIFRLRKQIGGGRSKLLKDTYRQMKLSKMNTMASMFDEGDERVGILIFLSQLESRVNEMLDTFDAEYLLTSESAKPTVQKQFAQMVAVLLEEEHLCRTQYRRLVPETGIRTAEEDGDETDGFVALLFDEKIYESFVSRETIRRRLVAGAQRLRDEEEMQLNGGKPRDSDGDGRTVFTFAQPGRPKQNAATGASAGDDGKQGPGRGRPTGPDRLSREDRMSLVSHVLPAATAATAGSPLSPTAAGGHRVDAAFNLFGARKLAGIPSAPANATGARPGSPNMTAPLAAAVPDLPFEELVQDRKAAWVQNIFGSSASDELIKKYIRGVPVVGTGSAVAGGGGGAGCETQTSTPVQLSANTLMARVLRHPLQDLSSGKFLSAFDVYAGRDPAQQKFLCSVNFVSPAMAIQLPEMTNFMKVKYKSSIDGDRIPESTDAGAAALSSSPAEAAMAPTTTTTTSRAVATPRSKTVGKKSANGRSAAGGRGASVKVADADPDAAHAGALEQIRQWGGATRFVRASEMAVKPQDKELFQAHENLRVFHELQAVTKTTATLGGAGAARGHKAGAVSSTTALTVAFQRLNPLSPNRGPEWGVYKDLFGGYRTLTPRLLEVSTVDHILLRACERHYQRMTYRYETCLMEANQRSTNSQMALTTAERFFRDSYVLTDFQESIVDELESRYGYPELVAKNLYEILCYLDATADKDGMFALYLDVVRGFKSPTSIHFTLYMLYQMSYGWPTSNPLAEVSREEVATVLQYMYRDANSVLRVDVMELLTEYDMATRSAPITFMTMRSYLSQVMLHNEEPLLLYFNGLFNRNTPDESVNGIGFEAFMDIITTYWQPKSERACLVRFLSTGLGFNRDSLLSVSDCANLALSSWCSGLW